MAKYSAGVLHGEELQALYDDAKANKFALPAVNVIGTDSVNAVLETAAKVKSPVIIQFSNGGSSFRWQRNAERPVAGKHYWCSGGAMHVHNVAEYYGVPVVMHTDHAAKKWLPWIDGLLIIIWRSLYGKRMVSHYSARICSTSAKNLYMKILKSLRGILNA